MRRLVLLKKCSVTIINHITKPWLWIYEFIFVALIPLIIIRLLWRSRINPGYRKNLKQRFGITKLKFSSSIWVHAVSVGEVNVATTFLNELSRLQPGVPIVITTTTPTGAAQLQHLTNHRNVYHNYCPYDLTSNWQRFLSSINPKILIIIETELWPNLIHACAKAKIPLVVANACISPRSFKRYCLVKPLLKDILNLITLVIAQSAPDANRFLTLGLPKQQLRTAGNIKFDSTIPSDLASKTNTLMSEIHTARPIWIAASTHAGEEEIILAAQQQILTLLPQTLLIIVPRHPERFNVVAKLIKQHNFSLVRRSKKQYCAATTSVYLADTMGELYPLYNIANVAFIGGSLVKVGGHNLIEPASLAKALLSGPHLEKCQAIANVLQNQHCLTIVHEPASITRAVVNLLQNNHYCIQQGKAAQQVAAQNRGALAQHITLINTLLTKNTL